MDYHSHFHKVLRVLDDSVGVQGTHFVCGSHTAYLQNISLLRIVQLFDKLHKHDDCRKYWIWVGC